MKINCNILLFIFFFTVFIIIIFYMDIINYYLGGVDDCLICRKVHFNGYLTNWTISHFILFLIAGYICPESLYIIILAGISWEFVELYLEYISKTNHDHILFNMSIIKKCDTKMPKDKFWGHYWGINQYKNTELVWCSGGAIGSLMDIVVDIIGVFTGIYIHKLVYK
jgi:hypothetical protein